MISNRVPALTIPVLLTLASTLAGCSRGASTTTAPAEDAKAPITDAATSAAVRPPMRPFRHSGLGGLAFNAAHDAQLTDDQIKSVEEIQTKYGTNDPSSRQTYQDYQAHVAAGIRAGKFDQAQLHADFAAFDALKRGEDDREAEALNALHALATPEQRTTIVNGVKTKQAAMDAQKIPELPDGGVSDRTKATLTRMTTDLTLDPGQQKRVSDLLVKDERQTIMGFPARREEQRKRVEAFVASFEQADFDAKTLEVEDGGAKPAHEQMEKETQFLGQLVAVLKPDQRDKLAAQRTPPPPGQHHMIPGMGGPGGPMPPGMPPMPQGAPPGAPGAPPLPPGHP